MDVRWPILLALTVGLALTAGCTAPVPDSVSATTDGGSSKLVPTFRPQPRHAARHAAKATRAAAAEPRRHRRPGATRNATPARVDPSPGPTPSRPTASARSASPSRMTAHVRDATGDVRGGSGPSPSYVDLTGAELTRQRDGFELRVSVAGDLPARQGPDGRTMNVASFYDTDGDGAIDYEVWATLADDGWGSSYRYPDGARFGADSGVSVHPEGRTLVLRFPLDHLGAARSFRWAVGSEWGSYAQIGSGTTAADHAPGSGATAFPG